MATNNNKIKIDNKEYPIEKGFKLYLKYEEITNKNAFDFLNDNHKSITDTLYMFYSALLAADKELELTFDELVELIDKENGIIQQFLTLLFQASNEDKVKKK